MAEPLATKMLEAEKPENRNLVLAEVAASGIKESDPVFMATLAIVTAKVVVEQTPKELRQTFTECLASTRDELSGYEKVAMAGIKHEVSKTVDQLVAEAIAKGSEAKNVVTYKSLIGAGAMALGLLLVGALGGMSALRWFAQMDNRGLTAAEVTALDFGQSKEGRFAQQLLEWNPDLLNGECESRAQDLGAITIGDGTRKATSGYCFVWRQPPDKREFTRE